MTIRVEIKGANELLKKLGKYSDDVQKDVSKEIRKSALAIQGEAVKSIQKGPKTGRLYTTHNKSIPHQASAAGEAPASDTGMLAGSIYADIEKFDATVGTRLDYGRMLELGTMQIAERPWLRPAIERRRQKMIDNLERILDR